MLVDKEDVVYVHGGTYSTIKILENLPSVTTWMDLKDVMPSEINQTENDKYYMFSFICGI